MAHEKKTDPKKVVTEVLHRPKVVTTEATEPYYRIARAFSHVSLEREVKELAKEGYEPLGGVSVEPPDGQGHGTAFLQSMVLK